MQLLLLRIAAFVVALVLAGGVGWHYGAKQVRLEAAAEREVGVNKARETEQLWQGVVNGTVENYDKEVNSIRQHLDNAISELRKRPTRPTGVPTAPHPECSGATGRELSGEDAEFLAREAARADTLRAGLEACYEVISLGGG